MENMEIFGKLRAVPEDAKKPIKGGKLNGFTDINAMWRIEKLTEVFGPCGVGWWPVIKDQRILAGANGEIKAFVDIDLFVVIDGKVSQPIPGVGGSSFIAIEKGKPVTSDECFKMAYTDAISVAAKALGLGADVYRGYNDSKYNRFDDEQPRQPQGQQQRPQAALPPLPQGQGATLPPPAQNAPQGAQRAPQGQNEPELEPREGNDGYYYCDDCHNIITGANGMSPKEVAIMAMKQYNGAQLCFACGKRRWETGGRR